MIEPISVTILPTKYWIESDIIGARHVMAQHEGCEPFCYATFHYDYRYTSNSGTYHDAIECAKGIGATEPIEQRHKGFPPPPTVDELEKQISLLQVYLAKRKDELPPAASKAGGED